MIDAYFKNYFWTFQLFVLGVAGVLAARAVNTVLAESLRLPPSAIAATAQPQAGDPAGDAKRSEVPTQALLERNVFQADRDDLNPTPETPEDASKQEANTNQCEKSSMRPKLVATVVSEDPTRSVAIFSDPSTNETVGHYVGDKLLDQATLLSIDWRKVKVDNGGHCETFSIEEDQPSHDASAVSAAPPPPPPPGGEGVDESKVAFGEGVKKTKDNEYEIPRAEIDNVLSNLNAVATQARIVPSFQNGKANGFKLFSIRPNSLYSKIGIQNGDVIQKINGYEINSPDKALEIYSKLKDASTITVDLIRRGKTQTLSYSIR
jgi:general secretion pathway protein C